MTPCVCFCGGGTGGHLVPNFALHLEFSSRGWQSFFLIPGNDFDLEFCRRKKLAYYQFSGTQFYKIGRISTLINLVRALWETYRIFSVESPKLVIGTGGYGAFPVYLYCLLASIPFYTVEPNQVAGKVNRWFGKYANLQFTCHDDVYGISPSRKVRNLGTPLPYDPPLKEKSGSSLLVFGASQGASSINQFILAYLKRFGSKLPVPVTWILGPGRREELSGLEDWPGVRILDYSDSMQELYQNASLVLARSGAGTVAEVQYFRVPAIFIPFPFHKDRQQYKNCAKLVESGACLLWEDGSLEGLEPLGTLQALLSDSKQLVKMRSNFPQKEDSLARQGITDSILEEQKVF